MAYEGLNIIRSAQTISAFWEEAEAFKKELWDVLQNPSFPNPSVEFISEIEDAPGFSYCGGAGWVYDAWHWSFRARDIKVGRGQRPIAGQLSVLVDIGGEQRPARTLGFPCIVVAWAYSSAGNWVSEFQKFWPVEGASANITSSCLFIHPESDANGPMKTAHWFYILPLTSVRDAAAVMRLVVNPVLALISGETVGHSFAEAPEVLRFDNESGEVRFLKS